MLFTTYTNTFENFKLKKLIAKKFRLWSKYKKCKSHVVLEKYNFVKSEIKTIVRTSNQRKQNKIFSCKNKKLYDFIKKVIKPSDLIPISMDFANVSFSNDVDIANSFNGFFHSVFVPSSKFQITSHSPQNFEPITLKELNNSINKFSNNTCKGPEGVPIYFLKKLDSSFFHLLKTIFNPFLKYNYISPGWKYALVSPIYKRSGLITEIKKLQAHFCNNRIFKNL